MSTKNKSRSAGDQAEAPVFVLPDKKNKAVSIKLPISDPTTSAKSASISTDSLLPGVVEKSTESSTNAKTDTIATTSSQATSSAPTTTTAPEKMQHQFMAPVPYYQPRFGPPNQYMRPNSSPSIQHALPFHLPIGSPMPHNIQPRPSGPPNLIVAAPPSFHPPSSQQLPQPSSQLDVHAKNFIPLWLRAVSESKAIPKSCCPLPTINYGSYISEFAGSRVLSPLDPPPLPPINKVPVIKSTSPDSLDRNGFYDYFFECLQNEIAAQGDDLLTLTLYGINFSKDSNSVECYKVQIPGLREHSPRIELGDIVLVRRVCPLRTPPVQQLLESVEQWYTPGGGKDQGLAAPNFLGQEHHAVVYGLNRAKEDVLLRIDGLQGIPRQGICNLAFIVQEHRVTPLWRSIAIITEELHAWPQGRVKSDWIGQMLFPEPKDSTMQTKLPKGVFGWQPFDPELNYEQKKAVDAIVMNQYGTVPYLISGPPGTGKTKTLVEAVLQLLRRPHDHITPHLLVCAPSDPAADTIALRLSKHLNPSELFRLNNWSRSSAEVPGELLPFTFMQNDLFSLPHFHQLMQYKVVVATCTSADMLVQARLTNQDLSKYGLETMFAISPSSILNISPVIHWTALLIDEAAQATEPEALIPLSVVSTTLLQSPSEDRELFAPQFIMVGDEHQLGAHLFKSGSLATSMFARLFARPFYVDHPLSRIHGSRPLNRNLLPLPRPAFTNLVRNYRSHPAILATSSVLFYSDTLVPESVNRSGLITHLPLWKPPYHWPLLFVQSSSPDALEDITSQSQRSSGPGLYNPGEVSEALKLVQALLAAQETIPGGKFTATKRVLEQREIAVIAPFRAQVSHLRNTFRRMGFGNVNIGPLEAFQGLESRVVILCTTRTRLGATSDFNGIARFVQEDIASNRGVIGQRKKFNVAMTRAKEALFVIGDERSLTCTGDECWIQFLTFVGRNGAVQYEQDGKQRFQGQMVKWTGRVGRLEAALRFGVEMGDENGRPWLGVDEFDQSSPSSSDGMVDHRSHLRGVHASEDVMMVRDGIIAENTIRGRREILNGRVQGNEVGELERSCSAPLPASMMHMGQPVNIRGGELSDVEDGNSETDQHDIPTIPSASTSVHPPPGFERSSSAKVEVWDRDPRAEIEKSGCATQ